MKKHLMVVVIITCLIILIGCSSPCKANFIIKYTVYEPAFGVEVLKWVLAEMVFYYGLNNEGEIVCIYTTDKDPSHGLSYQVVGNVLDVYFEGVVNYNTGEVNGEKLEYFDHRDDMLLYYPLY